MSEEENLITINNFVKELHALCIKYELSLDIPIIQIPTQIEPIIKQLHVDNYSFMYVTNEGMVKTAHESKQIWK